MSAVRGPALSLSASGAIAKTLVYSSWKGIPVARHYVVPANPKTAGQVTQRGYMSEAVDGWHAWQVDANQDDYDAWRLRASQLGPMSGFNAWCKQWVDTKVAGNPVSSFLNQMTVLSASHSAFQVSIQDSAGGSATGYMKWGATAGFQGNQETDAESSGLISPTAFDTGLLAGDFLYFWFLTNADAQRSGLYKVKLT